MQTQNIQIIIFTKQAWKQQYMQMACLAKRQFPFHFQENINEMYSPGPKWMLFCCSL